MLSSKDQLSSQMDSLFFRIVPFIFLFPSLNVTDTWIGLVIWQRQHITTGQYAPGKNETDLWSYLLHYI